MTAPQEPPEVQTAFEALKLCPFCGDGNLTKRMAQTKVEKFKGVRCNGCGARAPTLAAWRRIAGEEHLARRPGSPEWQIRFTVAGKRVRQSAGTTDKRLAAAAAHRLHAETYRALVLHEQPPAREMTWGDASARFWSEVAQHTRYGQRSQRYMLRVLDRAIGVDTLLTRITDARVAEAAEQMQATLSPATINRYVQLLDVVCRRAAAVWGAQVSGWDAAHHRLREPAGREVYLTQEQARRLMGEACGHLRPILLVELLTGLRMRNVVELQWENVSLDLGRALLIQKGGRRLRVELPSRAVDTLAAAQPDPSERIGAVFRFGNPVVSCRCPRCVSPQYRNEPIRDIRRAFGGAARRAGVLWNGQTKLRFHDLRHTAASWMLEAGGDLIAVKEALGHAQISTTARYSHLMPGRARKVAEAVSDSLEQRLMPAGRMKA
jgi:integrase